MVHYQFCEVRRSLGAHQTASPCFINSSSGKLRQPAQHCLAHTRHSQAERFTYTRMPLSKGTADKYSHPTCYNCRFIYMCELLQACRSRYRVSTSGSWSQPGICIAEKGPQRLTNANAISQQTNPIRIPHAIIESTTCV